MSSVCIQKSSYFLLKCDLVMCFVQGQYHRLDKFQEDVFAILEKAREISRSDTEVPSFTLSYWHSAVF